MPAWAPAFSFSGIRLIVTRDDACSRAHRRRRDRRDCALGPPRGGAGHQNGREAARARVLRAEVPARSGHHHPAGSGLLPRGDLDPRPAGLAQGRRRPPADRRRLRLPPQDRPHGPRRRPARRAPHDGLAPDGHPQRRIRGRHRRRRHPGRAGPLPDGRAQEGPRPRFTSTRAIRATFAPEPRGGSNLSASPRQQTPGTIRGSKRPGTTRGSKRPVQPAAANAPSDPRPTTAAVVVTAPSGPTPSRRCGRPGQRPGRLAAVQQTPTRAASRPLPYKPVQKR